MDMKHILQAMDSVATKPVEGVSDMAKFLSVVDKNADVQILQEANNPHKVTLPVQMAMQHYQHPKVQSKTITEKKVSILKGYYQSVEEEIVEEQTNKRRLVNQYASTIAERVLMKENANPAQPAAIAIAKRKSGKYNKDGKRIRENEIPGHSMGFTGGVGPGIGDYKVDENPLVDFNKDDPIKTGVELPGHNPGSIEYRIMRARGQIKDFAKRVDSNELIVWESIARQFPELAMNMRLIEHGIQELANKRKKGGRGVHNIDKHIGETTSIKEINARIKQSKKKTLKNSNPCWTGYHPVGTKKKAGRTVPNCVPSESINEVNLGSELKTTGQYVAPSLALLGLPNISFFTPIVKDFPYYTYWDLLSDMGIVAATFAAGTLAAPETLGASEAAAIVAAAPRITRMIKVAEVVIKSIRLFVPDMPSIVKALRQLAKMNPGELAQFIKIASTTGVQSALLNIGINFGISKVSPKDDTAQPL